VTLENNANGEQIIIEELSVEEQLTQDLAKKRERQVFTIIC
jgi:molecular chaperone GrpE